MSRGDVQNVLIFENRGREVGATIDHPHGQIYAFDHVPERTKKRIDNSWQPDSDSTRRFIEKDGWAAWVTYAPIYPVSIEIAPVKRIADLTTMSETDRIAFAEILRDVLKRLDRLYASKTPYMMWINQQPKKYSTGWFNIEIISPWREKDITRFIAAAEVATGEYFNPLNPEDLAKTLRSLNS